MREKNRKFIFFTGGVIMDYKFCENFEVFISRLDSHSDGTHSLQRIH